MYLTLNPFLIVLAVVPAVILLIFVYKQDKLEKESPAFLLKLLLWGALSTAIAIVLETVGDFILTGILQLYEQSLIYLLLSNFIVVGLSEEWSKYVVLKFRTWKNPEFNCQFDGIVYSVFVSLGFAIWENIKYVSIYGLQTALLRAVTAVPGHASFGVFMGIWYGMAKRAETNGRFPQSKNCLRMSIIMPAIIHGLYDFIASSTDSRLTWLFTPFIILMFIVAFISIKKTSKNDRFINGVVMNDMNNYSAPPKDNDYTKYRYRQ